ncbi:MAG: FAD-dependent oxidoreductase [Eubacteriales bacterium]
MKVIIVGGVAGGASAAARLRRLDENAQIIIFERTGFVSYANCGLPYYISGVIEDPDKLTLNTPESFWDRFRVDVRTRHEVTSIDTVNKTVTVHGLDTGKTYQETYDKLLLSPGARPVMPKMPGLDSSRLFTLRTVEDTLKIKQFIEEKKPKSAVVVGGGFIGLETAENLHAVGIDVTLVELLDQVLTTLDYDMASFIHSALRCNGIKLRLGSEVEGFSENEDGIQVKIKGSDPINTDIVLFAIGVRPDSDLAKAAGLELGIRGSILVNDRMETSEKDIYAVGDAVQIKHMITGKPALISLAGPASKQGRIAADNINGGDSRYKGSPGTSVLKLFDMSAASTGITEAAAKTAGYDYDKIILSPPSHATYYPGAKTMTIKLIFKKPTLKILGAQIVGYDGVDKRIDVISTAIALGASALDLMDLDLAYAPPYSSSKDPVNMAGFIIDNIATGKVKQFHWNDIANLPKDGSVILLDTRTPAECSKGIIDGFINIPVDDLRERIGELDRNKPVYITCQVGIRGYIACRILEAEGFDVYNLSGGYRFYEAVMKDKCPSAETYICGADKN